ncbi:cytochrome c oxidase subunit 3 [Permianibacter aggregans]|uniref:cytochrome-c oxidase n=1 Tax=Permianibacter aggregans TaxID=1510150 RepID=A0A4R6UPX8_9GAMM|nr:cytochrome c oxidase subunit 3 [Permianibacter aggregans]QGX39064.1 cytochrome c oxidase subunit 3 [Permianibacter aggregans]TDQ47729.1 cytochrome c oxidase subunit 3 [Permianibacter aggregans]
MANTPSNNGEYEHYYVPEQSKLPFIGSIALGLIVFGAASTVHQNSGLYADKAGDSYGLWVLLAGIALIIGMLWTWWSNVIDESLGGLYSKQMDRSFRQGMMWFITSEVMFFAAFFGALFYIRLFVVPWLGGEGAKVSTHELLWPDFVNVWPLTLTPGGDTTTAMPPWGLPLINTIILVTSSVTLTISHHALIAGNNFKAWTWLFWTVALGAVFLYLQGVEYHHAYTEMGLTLDAGVYGSTFFMLTGFHGMHVTLGTLMLLVMLFRMAKGHFTPEKHFAFEAAAWYWHFVDVVWIGLFIFVYCL